jgi:hypothetical protein
VTLADHRRDSGGVRIGSVASNQASKNFRADKGRRCTTGLDPVVHRLPLFAIKSFLPCLPEVRADPNIVTAPGIAGSGGLVP